MNGTTSTSTNTRTSPGGGVSGALENLNIRAAQVLTPPAALKAELPASAAAMAKVQDGRAVLQNILNRTDPRLFVVVGPCSIHDPAAAMDYARRLQALSEQVSDTLVLVMRVYFEKPRTTVGWKGLINDPDLDDSFHIGKGLRLARRLLIDINALGLPTATEALDPISPQYLQDLVAWSAIGARTTESQTHREMASGLSSPVGFKNGTDGSLGVAINALQSAASGHSFLGINQDGQVSVIETGGNAFGHVILRGGSDGPNFDADNIARCEAALAKVGAPANIVVDCSHANSGKDPARQPDVARNAMAQIQAGNRSILGLMLESFIEAGNQSLGPDLAALRYGQSVTDGCISWDSTEALLLELAEGLRDVLPQRIS